jgi:hypothetical protein
MDNITFVGMDVHKATICVAVAESRRGGSKGSMIHHSVSATRRDDVPSHESRCPRRARGFEGDA